MPHSLTHPDQYWKSTAFADKNEYDEWLSAPAKLGKPSTTHPHGGMKQTYHDFADKVWEKFKVTKREIAASTQVCIAYLYIYIDIVDDDTVSCRFIGAILFLVTS
jgi:hypothetical protein